MGGWAQFDAAAGVSKDNWNVQLFAQNMADRNASVYTNSAQFILTETPLRPRIAGREVRLQVLGVDELIGSRLRSTAIESKAGSNARFFMC